MANLIRSGSAVFVDMSHKKDTRLKWVTYKLQLIIFCRHFRKPKYGMIFHVNCLPANFSYEISSTNFPENH